MNYLDDFIYIFFNFSLINSIFDSNKETIVGSFFEDDLVYLLFSTFFTFLFSPTWTSLKFRMLWPVSPVVKIRKKDNKVISIINSILANFSSSHSQTDHVKIWFSFSPLPHLLHLPLLTNMSLLEIQNALASLTTLVHETEVNHKKRADEHEDRLDKRITEITQAFSNQSSALQLEFIGFFSSSFSFVFSSFFLYFLLNSHSLLFSFLN